MILTAPMSCPMNQSWHPTERSIVNRLNLSVYRMLPAARVVSTEGQLSNLASICNQPAIYNFLFKERLNGRPYGIDDAQKFLEWAARGWNEQSHFVFLLLAPSSDLIAGALDIKSGDRKMAEVGYWCSALHRGLMSNAVGELKSLAREASFAALFARVRSDNAASVRVLERSGFVFSGNWPGDSSRHRYEVVLTD